MRLMVAAVLSGMVAVLSLAVPAFAQGFLPQASYRLTIQNRNGQSVTTITDGDAIEVEIVAPAAAPQARTTSLYLEGDDTAIGTCTIPSGQQNCVAALDTRGWFWDDDGAARAQRILTAPFDRQNVATATLTIRPRPVVLVHGFGADFHSWDNYLGPAGYLARLSLPGYAVGDGQVPGVMNTGNLLRPNQTTNTIAQNAVILGEYIAAVKAETGAEQVDLVVHSMGGLISRYYIARVMQARDVTQLIMLGTPNGGTDCATLVGSIKLYQPAAIELRADYIQNVFNPQITEQRGVPFHTFAGTPIRRRILTPCTATPNDLVVSLDSAGAFTDELVEVTPNHLELNTSEDLFVDYVAPLLRQPYRELQARASLPAPTDTPETVQFSRIYTGTITPPLTVEHVIHIDEDVAVASFGIYDPSRSLTVTVRGASGNVITLDPNANGLIALEDPHTLFYLGYGFENPRPGPWRVTVQPTAQTPPLGTPYAILVQYVGGASIRAQLDRHIVSINQDITLRAELALGDAPLPIEEATILLQHPDGVTSALPVADIRDGVEVRWQVPEPGVYGLDISLRSTLPDGMVVERATYRAFQVFEQAPALNN